jgi:predicted O-methyltransferase YrrM
MSAGSLNLNGPMNGVSRLIHRVGDRLYKSAAATSILELSSYYFFLAGLVRSQHCKRILEIGIHYRGSSNSMLCGIADQKEAQIVTVDITDINPQLHQTAGITELTADANSEAVIKLLILMMGDAPIDLL